MRTKFHITPHLDLKILTLKRGGGTYLCSDVNALLTIPAHKVVDGSPFRGLNWKQADGGLRLDRANKLG